MTITFFNPCRYFGDTLDVARYSILLRIDDESGLYPPTTLMYGKRGSSKAFASIMKSLSTVHNRPSWLCVDKFHGMPPTLALMLMFELASKKYGDAMLDLHTLSVSVSIDFSRFDDYHHTPFLWCSVVNRNYISTRA